MLGQVVPMDLEYQIFDEGENGARTLVLSGKYQEAKG
jgi:hypothetical protein